MRVRSHSKIRGCGLAVVVAACSLPAPSVHAENRIGPGAAAIVAESGIDDGDGVDPATEAGTDEDDPTGAATAAEDEDDDDDDAGEPEEDDDLPLVEIEASVALGYETVVPGGAAARRVSDVFTELGLAMTVNLGPAARVGAVLAFEPVTDPAPGEDRAFEDHGLFVEELYAGLDVGAAELQIGKIAPTFGWAAGDAPGLYGGEIAGEYELVEQLGMQARVTLSEAARSGDTSVEHALHLAWFAADTTFLSDSLFTSRGRIAVSQGGVGNTGFPESFALAYTSEIRDAGDELAGPSFQAALRRLAPGSGDERAEWGFLGAFEDRWTLGRDLWLSPIVEAAYFLHAEGETEPAWALALGAELAHGPWRLSSTGEARDILNDGSPHDYALTANLGRIFRAPALGEVRADVAYALTRDEDGRAHFIGLQFERELDFLLFR